MGLFINTVIDNTIYNNFLNIHYFGTFDCNSADVYGPFARDQYMLFAIHYGKGTLTLGDSICLSEDESIFITHPNQLVKLVPDKEDPWCYSWVAFDGQLAGIYIKILSYLNRGVVKIRRYEYIQRQMFKMYRYTESSIQTELRLQSIFLDILAAISAECSESDTYAIRNQAFMSPKQYVDFAVEYINRNYHRSDLSVTEIAGKLHINRSYLTRIFTKHLGFSPSDFITNLRLDHAKGMLIDSSLSVSCIANSCGFQDPFYFSRIFSKMYQMSPTEMRISKKKSISL